jgi:hypothetical protein
MEVPHVLQLKRHGKASPVVGCELDSMSVRLVQTTHGPRSRLRVAERPLRLLPACAGVFDDRWAGAIARTVRDTLASEGFQGHRLVVGLPNSLVTYRRLTVPMMGDEELARALPWQLARECDLRQTEVCCDFYALGCRTELGVPKRDIIAVHAPMQSLDLLERSLLAEDLEPVAMESTLGATARCFWAMSRGLGRDGAACAVLLGPASTTILVVREGSPTFLHSFGCGQAGWDRFQGSEELAGRFVQDVLRELRICRYYLEERYGRAAAPTWGCILGAAEMEGWLRDAMGDSDPMPLAPSDQALGPIAAQLTGEVLSPVSLNEWIIPIGLSMYETSELIEEGTQCGS